MKSNKLISAVALGLVLCLGTVPTCAGEPNPPSAKDRCAVCGMYVNKYPNWVATVVFEDRSQVFFDGPKDLFTYILDLEKFGAQDREVSRIFVTDYYRVQPVDAKTAHFVAGSDVMGPMGHELVPLESREHAETFVRDHGGKEILVFDDVTPAKIPR